MKYLLLSIVVAAAVSVATFGIAGASDVDHGSAHTCAAATTQAAECPTEGALASLNFHVNALQKVSQAFFQGSSLAAFVALLLLAAAAVRGTAGLLHSLALSPTLALTGRAWREWSHPPGRQRLVRWLALRKHSPTTE